jgi:putative aldouronate transport system substrate-binding protein
MDQNAHWQALRDALNVDLVPVVVPFADFDVRWTEIQASMDLPDILCTLNRPSTLIHPDFLGVRCADLTPYLAGDAITEYPNLAAIPTRSWKTTLVDGKIYGVPVTLRACFQSFWAHREIIDLHGLSYPRSAVEFKEIAELVNRPGDNVWAIGNEGGSDTVFGTVNGLWNAVLWSP